ncbi:MAG: aminoacyl-tRNA hydrolase [Elusimicrobiota bacterium]
MALKLVVGLGNPGPEYERTRHNVGFRLADRLAGEAGSLWRDFKGLGVAAQQGGLWVAKPMTYMNLSGDFVKQFAAYHNIEPSDILIVYDELALALGKIRIRKKGSAGGQKGMLSILTRFQTQEIARLRIGIGPKPENADAANFVLGRFSRDEDVQLNTVLDLAADAVDAVRDVGVDSAMNRYNPTA